uniref:RAB4B, member RAS onco family n=1 Tax=Equus caballus TaxID=9796 RepID=A0A9L0TM79_HORSE
RHTHIRETDRKTETNEEPQKDGDTERVKDGGDSDRQLERETLRDCLRDRETVVRPDHGQVLGDGPAVKGGLRTTSLSPQRGAVSGQTPASGVTGSPWPHRSVTRSYYRGAAGALLVYDITSRETYNSLAAWLTDARTLASPNIVVILCGNKKDLDPEREVTFLEASRFAQENELMFLETSALTGENVEEAFLKCARTILNKIDSGELDPERMGSGIQYGDASLRQLRQPRSAQAVAPQPCGC